MMLIVEVTYIITRKIYKETWTGFAWKAMLNNWWPILRMGIPGLFMVSLEEWCFEMMTFIAGSIGEITLGAHAVAFQIQSIIYMVPLGIFTAVNIRVGQKLGALDPSGARYTYNTALGIVAIVALSTCFPIILLREYLPLIFTEDSEVCSMASRLLPLLLLFQLCEGFAGVSEAVLLACGKQTLGAVIIFLGYYCVGMPTAFLLTYRFSFGIIGAWFGLLVGFTITTIAYVIFAIRTNWIFESRQARQNIRDAHFDCSSRNIMKDLLDDCENNIKEQDCYCKQIDPSMIKVKQDSLSQEVRSMVYSGKSMRISSCLLFALVFLWIFGLYNYFNRPNSHWLVECESARFATNGSIPSYCVRMRKEERLIPFLKQNRQSDTITRLMDTDVSSRNL